MSIVERLFPPSELGAVQESLNCFAEAYHPNARASEVTSAREATNPEFEPTSTDPCAYLVLIRPRADDMCSNAVYVLDKSNLDKCQQFLSAAQKVESSALSQQSGNDLLAMLSLPQNFSKAHSFSCLETGNAAGRRTAAPRTVLDEQTADKLLSMPLITDVEKDMLVSMIPSLLARAKKNNVST